MNKTSKFLTVGAIALCLTMNNFASAKTSAAFSVAVVDVQQVIVNSPQVAALKVEQKNKLSDLMSFIERAKADVSKQTDEAKKKSLEEGYNKELNVRKTEIDKDFTKKMTEIDKNINAAIQTKSASYDLVLTKNTVLKGGTDITNEIIKSLK